MNSKMPPSSSVTNQHASRRSGRSQSRRRAQFRRLTCERLESRQLLSFLPLTCGSHSPRQVEVAGEAGQPIRWSQSFFTERGEGESGTQQRGGSSRLIVSAFSPAMLIVVELSPLTPASTEMSSPEESLDASFSPLHGGATITSPLVDAEILEAPHHVDSGSTDLDASLLAPDPSRSSLRLPASSPIVATLPTLDDTATFIEPLWLEGPLSLKAGPFPDIREGLVIENDQASLPVEHDRWSVTVPARTDATAELDLEVGLWFSSADQLFRDGWRGEDTLIDESMDLLSGTSPATRRVSMDPAALMDLCLMEWLARSNDLQERTSEPMVESESLRALNAGDLKTAGEGGQVDAIRGVEYLRAEEGHAVYQVLDIAVAVEETVDTDVLMTAESAPQADGEAASIEAASLEPVSLEPVSLEPVSPDASTSPLTKAILLPSLVAALFGRRRLPVQRHEPGSSLPEARIRL